MAFDSRSCGGCSEMEAAKGSPASLKGRRVLERMCWSEKKMEKHHMRTKSQTAWETAARCATLAQEEDDPQEREHYERLRDAWITLAKRCEPFDLPEVRG